MKTYITLPYARRLIRTGKARLVKYIDPRTARPCSKWRSGAIMQLEVQDHHYGTRTSYARTDNW